MHTYMEREDGKCKCGKTYTKLLIGVGYVCRRLVISMINMYYCNKEKLQIFLKVVYNL